MSLPDRSPFDLGGHVALITGGNSGIGLGMAKGLAAHGADVVIWGTNPDKNDASIDEMGRIDSVFVNAGVSSQAPSFLDMTADEWRRVMAVNLDGAFYTCREATKHMVARFEDGDERGGSLVVTTSGSAYFGQQSGQNYGASKAGVIALMRGIAVQHARHRIRANAILPGWIESDMTAGALSWDRFVERNLPRVPMRRWGRPDDFAGIAVYLASSASSYQTGDVVTIDGGYHSF
jgi:NAD(P)-dependent dehydrogenase (short-subunit alcohol dehydrogenase family)